MNARHVLPEWPAAMRGGASPWIALLICALASCVAGCGMACEFAALLFPMPGVSLSVTDRAGAPISDAHVYVLNDDLNMRTAVDGSVHVLGCADGEPLRISVYKPGYEQGFLYLTKTSARLHLRLALARIDELIPDDTTARCGLGSLRGQIIDEDGKPIIGGTIRLAGTKRGAYSKWPVGEFNLPNILPGSYDAEISAIRFLRVRVPFIAIADSSIYCLVQLNVNPKRGSCLPIADPRIEYMKRDRAATVREQESDDISDRPTHSLQETVRSMGSIRYDNPDGGPR